MLERAQILSFFFFNDTATTEIYTLSLHDALPISFKGRGGDQYKLLHIALCFEPCILRYIPLSCDLLCAVVRSEEHTSELQSQSNLVCRLLLEKKKKHFARLTYSQSIFRHPRRQIP